jgi:hypothetical protein
LGSPAIFVSGATCVLSTGEKFGRPAKAAMKMTNHAAKHLSPFAKGAAKSHPGHQGMRHEAKDVQK